MTLRRCFVGRMGCVAMVAMAGCYASHRLPGPGDGDAPADAAVDAGPDDAGRDGPGHEDAGPTPPPDSRDRPAACEGEAVRWHVHIQALRGRGSTRAPCPWGVGDNLAPVQGRATARIEDRGGPELEPGAVLCDLELGPLGSGEDPFRYDDQLVVLLGDAVLAATDRALVERLPLDGRVRRWDWSRVAGAPMRTEGVDPYCLGEDEGLATCTVPAPGLPGRLEIALDPSLVDELAPRAFSRRSLYSVITIGDDDPETDCRYGQLYARSVVRFVPAAD